MVKSKNKESDLGLFGIFKLAYSFNLFEKKYTDKSLFYNFLLVLGVLFVINFYNYSRGVSEIYDVIGGTFIIAPLVLLFLYFFYYVFISSLTSESESFLKGYLVFSSIFLVIVEVLIILFFLLNLIGFPSIALNLLGLILGIYYIINMIINLKKYHNTLWQKVFFSLILLDVLIISMWSISLIFNVYQSFV